MSDERLSPPEIPADDKTLDNAFDAIRNIKGDFENFHRDEFVPLKGTVDQFDRRISGARARADDAFNYANGVNQRVNALDGKFNRLDEWIRRVVVPFFNPTAHRNPAPSQSQPQPSPWRIPAQQGNCTMWKNILMVVGAFVVLVFVLVPMVNYWLPSTTPVGDYTHHHHDDGAGIPNTTTPTLAAPPSGGTHSETVKGVVIDNVPDGFHITNLDEVAVTCPSRHVRRESGALHAKNECLPS